MNFRLYKVVKKFIYNLSAVKISVVLPVHTNDDSLFPTLERLIPCSANTKHETSDVFRYLIKLRD